MKRIMLKSKLHKARVTDRQLDYDGSLAVDADLLRTVGIIPFEGIHVYNITNGSRFETYAIEAPAGSGEICVNGAAAHLVEVGDLIIIAAYALFEDEEARRLKPSIVVLDSRNRVARRV